jgi:hypothetical protein
MPQKFNKFNPWTQIQQDLQIFPQIHNKVILRITKSNNFRLCEQNKQILKLRDNSTSMRSLLLLLRAARRTPFVQLLLVLVRSPLILEAPCNLAGGGRSDDGNVGHSREELARHVSGS